MLHGACFSQIFIESTNVIIQTTPRGRSLVSIAVYYEVTPHLVFRCVRDFTNSITQSLSINIQTCVLSVQPLNQHLLESQTILHNSQNSPNSKPHKTTTALTAIPPIYDTTTVSNNNAKFPYLKKDEYETWAMKMEYWIMNSDHNLWNIVLNGNSRKKTGRDPKGNIMIYFSYSDEEHLLFGGNDESKKMRKSMLKQEFSEFRVSESEGLHKGYDRDLLGLPRRTGKMLSSVFQSWSHFARECTGKQWILKQDHEGEDSGRKDAAAKFALMDLSSSGYGKLEGLRELGMHAVPVTYQQEQHSCLLPTQPDPDDDTVTMPQTQRPLALHPVFQVVKSSSTKYQCTLSPLPLCSLIQDIAASVPAGSRNQPASVTAGSAFPAGKPLSPRPSPVRPQSPTRQPTPSPVRQPTPPPSRPSQTNPFPFMEDDFSGGDYYVSPTRSNDAPPNTGQSAGGAEEPDALTIMSTKLDRCLEKVGVLESELNNTKKTLGSVVLKLVSRVKKLKGNVRKTKRRVIISDSEDEEASTKTYFDLEALSELASRDAQLRSDGTPERSYQRKDLRRRLRKQSNIPAFEKFQAQVAAVGTSIPADGVPAVSIPAGSSNVSAVSSSDKGKAPVVDETSKADLLSAQERALKNLHDAMLGEELARKVQAEEEANLARHREELAKKAQADPEGSFAQGSSLPVQRQREIDAASLLYTDAEWFHIMTQIATHTELSRQLLGDDVTEETFSERLADLMRRKRQAVAERIAKEKRDRPMTQGQQREFMRNFVKNQSCSLYQTGWSMAKVTKFTDAQLKEEFEKIQRTLERAKILDFKRSLPRSQPALEEPSSKKIRRNEDVPAGGFSPDPAVQATQGESLSHSATNVDATNVDGDPKVTTKSETFKLNTSFFPCMLDPNIYLNCIKYLLSKDPNREPSTTYDG
ncbi:hypothetical protein Tco_0098150 [Tanacetum coccineum]